MRNFREPGPMRGVQVPVEACAHTTAFRFGKGEWINDLDSCSSLNQVDCVDADARLVLHVDATSWIPQTEPTVVSFYLRNKPFFVEGRVPTISISTNAVGRVGRRCRGERCHGEMGMLLETETGAAMRAAANARRAVPNAFDICVRASARGN